MIENQSTIILGGKKPIQTTLNFVCKNVKFTLHWEKNKIFSNISIVCPQTSCEKIFVFSVQFSEVKI